MTPKIGKPELEAPQCGTAHGDYHMLRMLFDQSFGLIGLLSTDGVVLDGNKAALDMVGVQPEDIIGRPFWETPWWGEEERSLLKNAVTRAAKGEFVRFKTKHYDHAGKVHYIDFSLKPYFDDDGNVAYLIPEGRDITELTVSETERARLASIVESSGDAIISKNVDGVILTWNRGAEQFYGYSAKEALGRHIDMIVPPDRVQELERVTERVRDGEAVAYLETVRKRKDGTMLDIFLTLSPIRDEQGRVVEISSVAKNVTAMKEITRALKRNNQILETVSGALSEFISGVDPRVLFDQVLKNLLGLTDSEYGFLGEVLQDEQGAPYLKSHAMTNIAWDADTRRFYAENAPKGLEFRNLKTLFGAVMTSGEAVISNDPANDPRRGGLPKGHPPLKAFLGLPFFAGRKMVGMVGLANRPGGYDQELVGTLGVAMKMCANITEAYRIDNMRQQAEHDLVVSETRLRAILDSAVDGIVTINEVGVIQSFNPAAEKIFGYGADEVVGCKVNTLMPDPFCSEHDGYLRNYLSSGVAKIIGIGREVFGKRKDGTVFPMELSVSEVLLKDGRLFTGIVRDISERKRIERLKREFISTVSHELRTPLTSINGSLGLLLGGFSGELTDQSRSLLVIARNNTERLITLINDILDLEKLEAGSMSFKMEPVNLREAVLCSIEENAPLGVDKEVEFVLAAPDSGAFVMGDRGRLMQVITNLLSNAVKFSPPKGKVFVALTEEHGLVSLEVRDQGPGIPEEFRNRIFEKFAQADSSDARKKGGTGLGLSICKGIMEKLGGEIGFDSPPGLGATFHFSLPSFNRDPSRARSEQAGRLGTGASRKGRARILHVDDDRDIADVVSLVLKGIGDTSRVTSLAKARERLESEIFDLIILDVFLPDGSGLDLIPLAGDTPVMVFSVKEFIDGPAGRIGAVLLKSQAGNDKILSEAKRLLGMEPDE